MIAQLVINGYSWDHEHRCITMVTNNPFKFEDNTDGITNMDIFSIRLLSL